MARSARRHPPYRFLTLTASLVAAVLLLSGCATEIPADELPGYTVIQKTERDENGVRDFSFLDASGEEHETECLKDGFFSKRVCESEDGVLSFSFSVDKHGSVFVRRITVDGYERKMSRVSTELDGARRVWVPSDSIPEDKE